MLAITETKALRRRSRDGKEYRFRDSHYAGNVTDVATLCAAFAAVHEGELEEIVIGGKREVNESLLTKVSHEPVAKSVVRETGSVLSWM